MRTDVDVIIIGAGLGGLALAERLALSSQRRMRVDVLEQAEAPVAGRRNWSWYEAGRPHTRFDAHWPRWQMGAGFMTTERAFSGGRYGLLRGERLVASALAAMDASPGVTLRTGTGVSAIRAMTGGAQVETSQGMLSARVVVDTRPGGAELLDRAPWVRTGVRAEIRTGTASFTTETATLFHSLRREGPALCFETVLPLAPDHAQVEAVRISRRGDAARPDFDRAVENLIAGRPADIGPRMRSASPLGLSDHWPRSTAHARLAASRGAGLALVGAPGRDAQRALAWARPAFEAIMRDRVPPSLEFQSWPVRLAGRALLGRLVANPARLMSLAERVPGDGIVRMAGGSGSFADAFSLLRAML